MSKDIIRDFLKDDKRVNGKKYSVLPCNYSRSLSPSQYGGFLDKKRTSRKGK